MEQLGSQCTRAALQVLLRSKTSALATTGDLCLLACCSSGSACEYDAAVIIMPYYADEALATFVERWLVSDWISLGSGQSMQ